MGEIWKPIPREFEICPDVQSKEKHGKDWVAAFSSSWLISFVEMAKQGNGPWHRIRYLRCFVQPVPPVSSATWDSNVGWSWRTHRSLRGATSIILETGWDWNTLAPLPVCSATREVTSIYFVGSCRFMKSWSHDGPANPLHLGSPADGPRAVHVYQLKDLPQMTPKASYGINSSRKAAVSHARPYTNWCYFRSIWKLLHWSCPRPRQVVG